MNKKYLLFILSFFITSGFLVAYGQQNETVENNISNDLKNETPPNLFEKVISMYEGGIKYKNVIPVAIGILAFSYFIWKTAKILSKREVFSLKPKSATDASGLSLRKRRVLWVTEYVVIFPLIMYSWVVVCFFFMYVLNTSLSYDVLTLMMVGIISASRIAAHFHESLAEDIMKFLPFNLLFTLLYNPYLDFNKIIKTVQQFPEIMLELTIFIGFVALLEIILKLTYFAVTKIHHSSNKP